MKRRTKIINTITKINNTITKIILTGFSILLLLASFKLSSYLSNSNKKNVHNYESDIKESSTKSKHLNVDSLNLSSLINEEKTNNNAEKIEKTEKVKKLPIYSSMNSTATIPKSVLLKGINKVSNSKKHYQSDQVFEKMWDVDIGNMSYRSNFEMVDNHLYVGSNGNYFNDWHTWDEKSGVYKININNGQIKTKFADGEMGDMDVNGLLYYNRNLFFGNDNDEFLCTDLDGNLIWRIPVSGDVEHEPTLIKRKNGNIIVFATEVGEVRAVSPKNGNTVWNYFHPKFDGWKEGNNRFIFKLKTHFRSGYIFFNSPTIADFNRDGVMDLVYNGYDKTILNGINGKVIKNYSIKRQNTSFSNVSDSYHDPIFLGKGKNTKILSPEYIIGSDDDEKRIMIYDQNGNILNQLTVKKPERFKDFSYWYLTPKKLNNNEVAFISQEIIHIYNSKDNKFSKIQNFNSIVKEKSEYGDYYNYRSNFYGIVEILSNKIKTEKGLCRLIKWESYKDWKHAIIKVFSVNDNKELLTISLPSTAEGPMLVRDINGDGKEELLVECDGRLICYDISTLKI